MRSRVTLAIAVILGPATGTPADVIEVPGDQPTIQSAIDAAQEGDVVLVAPGRYRESINLLGKGITVRGRDPLNPAVVAATVIDGQGLDDRPITCDSGETPRTVIAGLTVTNGTATTGGGMLCAGSSSPTVIGCTFAANTALPAGSGGGLGIDGGGPTLLDCRFVENQATFGGAIAVRAGTLEARRCRLVQNTAAVGGGIFCSDAEVVLRNCRFLRNFGGTGGGGGVCVEGGEVEITGCDFVENVTDLYASGGGLLLVGAGAFVSRCTFVRNWTESGGGAVHAIGRSVTLRDLTVCGNWPEDIACQNAALGLGRVTGCPAEGWPGPGR
jgi:predicted outer membrane repeat protein